jgi:hypothetical protein
VFLDGTWIGVTPLGPIGVVEGEHSVWFRSRPGADFEPNPLDPRPVSIAVDDTVRVFERMGHLVWIESEPAGADVSVDGTFRGTTPVQLRVDVERTRSITVGGGDFRRAELDLGRLAELDRLLVSLVESPVRAEASFEPRPSRFGQWAPWGSLFVAGASAAVAIHFKERADDAFETYEASLLSGDLDHWRDRAERDDRYATAAWIVAESALVLGVYLLAKPLLADRAAAEVRGPSPASRVPRVGISPSLGGSSGAGRGARVGARVGAWWSF